MNPKCVMSLECIMNTNIIVAHVKNCCRHLEDYVAGIVTEIVSITWTALPDFLWLFVSINILSFHNTSEFRCRAHVVPLCSIQTTAWCKSISGFVEVLSSCVTVIPSTVSLRGDQQCDWLRVFLCIDLFTSTQLCNTGTAAYTRESSRRRPFSTQSVSLGIFHCECTIKIQALYRSLRQSVSLLDVNTSMLVLWKKTSNWVRYCTDWRVFTVWTCVKGDKSDLKCVQRSTRSVWTWNRSTGSYRAERKGVLECVRVSEGGNQ